MSEGNCSCCCAYLNPPWWVTMGYTPPASFQGAPPSQGIPAASQPPARPQAPPSTPAATPPPARPQAPPGTHAATPPTLQVAGSGAKPPITVGKVASDVLTGRVDQVVQDLGQLLHLL